MEIKNIWPLFSKPVANPPPVRVRSTSTSTSNDGGVGPWPLIPLLAFTTLFFFSANIIRPRHSALSALDVRHTFAPSQAASPRPPGPRAKLGIKVYYMLRARKTKTPPPLSSRPETTLNLVTLNQRQQIFARVQRPRVRVSFREVQATYG